MSTLTLPAGALTPACDTSPPAVLYGTRNTSYRWEVFTHNPATGLDMLAGVLDGVEIGSLSWSYYTAVKGSGRLTVLDLDEAAPGMMRVADINLITSRLRPVLMIDGLPDIPLGMYIITAAPTAWTATGRTYSLELHDKCSVLEQDAITSTWSAVEGTPILALVVQLLAAAGEHIDVDASVTTGLAGPRSWRPGDDDSSNLLAIVNDLLDTLGYTSLRVTGAGLFDTSSNIPPARRPIIYDALPGITRELIDGEAAIYSPNWSRDIDSYKIPNRIVAVASADGDEPPQVVTVTNENPDSPYSYQARGRWVTETVTGVDVPEGTIAEQAAALEAKARQVLLAASAPQAMLEVTHLPLPLSVGDVVRFRSIPAGIDARHVVTGIDLECTPTGLMRTKLQEVIDL
ncbi:MAG: hypothetical protein LBB54_04550 [Cellulomonadaceae bacterium]|jgi:hypothetical protein|nr:hypothetical protein [Cellulomonadaceae bacterium]